MPMPRFNRSLDALAALLFAACLVLVNFQIICRFVLSISVPWTEEVSRLIFVWLAFLGAAIGTREGALIVIDTLPEIVGPVWQTWVDPLIRIVSLAVILVLLIGSIPLVASVWPTTLATVDWISNGWMYLAFTGSFALMAIYSALPLLRGVRPRRKRAVIQS
jgi:TRAP-type C4-dicarboxylate transport system permease small subunit